MRIFIATVLLSMFGFPALANDTLYRALGETEGIRAIVQRTADLAFDDELLVEQFKHTKKDRLVRLITDQICELAGGPCDYRGLNMVKAHIKLGITTQEFNVFAELLQQAMREADIDYRTQNKLLALLAPMKRDIVER